MNNINKNNYEAWFLDYSEGNLNQEQIAELLLFVENNPELQETFNEFEIIPLNSSVSLSSNEKNNLKKSELLSDFSINEELIIRYVENDLPEIKRKEVETLAKQNKNFAADLRLYQLSKLQHQNETSGINSFTKKLNFSDLLLPENKDALLISLAEGLLNKEEEKQALVFIAKDKKLDHELSLYKKTILNSSPIVYHNKSDLKKERKIIPFTPFLKYTSYAAAACLIVFVLFTYTKPNQENIAKKNTIPKENNEKENNSILLKEQITPETADLISVKEELKRNHSSSIDRKNIKENLPVINEVKRNEDIVIEDFPLNQDSLRIEDREDIIIPFYELNKNDVAITNDSLPVTEDVATTSSSTKEQDYLTPKQLLIQRLNKKLFGTDKTTFGKEEVQKSAELGIAGITGQETTIANNTTDEANYFTFALGGFEFSRKKSK